MKIGRDEIITTIGSAILFFIIDLLWVAVLANQSFRDQVLRIQGTPMVVRSWIMPLIYLLMGAGIAFYSLPKVQRLGTLGDENRSVRNSFMWGGLLGLIIYGVFDLTNYAILRDWGIGLAMMDVMWGTFLTGLVTYLSHRILG